MSVVVCRVGVAIVASLLVAACTGGSSPSSPSPSATSGERRWPAQMLTFDDGRLSDGRTLPYPVLEQRPVRVEAGVLALQGGSAAGVLGLLHADGRWEPLASKVTSFATDGTALVYTTIRSTSARDQQRPTLAATGLGSQQPTRTRRLAHTARVSAVANGVALVTVGDALSKAVLWRWRANRINPLDSVTDCVPAGRR